VHRVPSVPVRSFDVGLPTREVERVLRRFAPDVVHVASPFAVGAAGLAAARRLALPTVAVYQTDMAAYVRRHTPGPAGAAAAATTWRWIRRVHASADLTLAPSSASLTDLRTHGVERTALWGRGVDASLHNPAWRLDALTRALRRELAPGGERLVGYVGRLAPEKQVDDLRAVAGIPGTRLVIVGDGPSRAALERELPDAVFTGHLGGDDLGRALASFDVFVHPGESETFCQTVQEALASGVPVVATGRGGPVDLVRSSVDGWLYRPGDLTDLRGRVEDLLGDDSKRRAFGLAARESVRDRTWDALGRQLVEHYAEARMLRRVDDQLTVRAGSRPHTHATRTDPARRPWTR
jgi:phosphatidylinositol alpha 1,6-mannosyltransferase